MIRTRGDKEELNESEEIANRQYCESEMIRKLFKPRHKKNVRALIMA
jgi:hypothetical protein